MGIQLIEKYFPNLTDNQLQAIAHLGDLYTEWNAKINVISRKDMDNFYEHHVLHALAIAKVIDFKPGTTLLDVGTGGGFPGVPLAILYPECKFHLIDAINKKITVVKEVSSALGLKNVSAEQIRVEQVKTRYDFVLSRAVTRFDKFYALCRKNVSFNNSNDLKNGILYLKGGDFMDELENIKHTVKLYPLSDYFSEEFFETKKVIHVAVAAKR